VLGTLFGYADRLEITGAIQLILPLNVTAAVKNQVKTAVEVAIKAHLAKLGPEEDIVFEDLVQAAQSVDRVLSAGTDHKDFRAFVGNNALPNIISNEKIDVGPLQRAFAKYILITSDIENLIVSGVGLSLTMGNALASLAERDAVKLAVKNAFNSALSGFAQGDKVVFNTFKGALENLVPSVPYTIAVLDLQGISVDGRTQVSNMGSPQDIHVRTVELAVVSPIQVSDIVITN
jgi:hypothetical protein